MNSNFDANDLIKWIKENNVLELLMDPRKTHAQLV